MTAMRGDEHERRPDVRDGRDREREDADEREPKQDRNRREDERRKRRERHWREWQRLNEERRRVWTPWLVIRYATHDLGLRPIPSGEAHWKSPDIWVESSDPLGQAVAGEENFVHARVFNLGKAPSVPTRVDFYWADPSIGLGAEHMNRIGTEWVQLEAHSAQDVRCNTPWLPVLVNEGHECLKVNCTNPLLDPIQHPFQPRIDRHAGQRNITVIAGAAGRTVEFSLAINNVFSLSLTTGIYARVQHLRVDRRARADLDLRRLPALLAGFGEAPVDLKMELATRFAPEARDHGRARLLSEWLPQARERGPGPIRRVASGLRGSACLRATLDDLSCHVAAAGPGSHATLAAASDLANRGSVHRVSTGIRLLEVELEPAQQRHVRLQVRVPATARRGDYVVVDLEQRVAEVPTGGYALVIEVP
jgi:hypothetical protein